MWRNKFIIIAIALVLIFNISGFSANNINAIKEEDLMISSIKVIDAKTLEVTLNDDEGGGGDIST